MTARYRCAWCGSYSNALAVNLRVHVVKRHRKRLEESLHPFESYGTRKPLDPPRKAGKGLLGTNLGVSGEGDSS